MGVSYVIARRQSFPAALRIVPRNRPDDAPSISFGPAKAWHNASTGCALPAVVVDTRPELRTGPRINVRIFFFFCQRIVVNVIWKKKAKKMHGVNSTQCSIGKNIGLKTHSIVLRPADSMIIHTLSAFTFFGILTIYLRLCVCIEIIFLKSRIGKQSLIDF